MSSVLPPRLRRLCLLHGMTMPQYVIPLPAGTEVAYEVAPPEGYGWVVTAFSLSARKPDGTTISPYDFVNDVGVKAKFTYRNRIDPLGLLPRERVSQWFYLGPEILDKALAYPRVVTDRLEGRAVNTMTDDVYLSIISYRYELPLPTLFEGLEYPSEVIQEILRR